MRVIYHIAIPCESVAKAIEFYGKKLACGIVRENEARVTFNFFGMQLVCHVSDNIDDHNNGRVYPRHFGVIFANKEEFNSLYLKLRDQGVDFIKEPFEKYANMPNQLTTYYLKDNANNVLEFKHHRDISEAITARNDGYKGPGNILKYNFNNA